jgi:hypothetical protein
MGLGTGEGKFDFDDLIKKAPKLVGKIKLDSLSDPNSLAALNDAGNSFRIIAHVIRVNPKGLFKKGWALFDNSNYELGRWSKPQGSSKRV